MKKYQGTGYNNLPSKPLIFLGLLISTIFLTTESYAVDGIDSSRSSAEITVSSNAANGHSHLCHLTKGLLPGCDISSFIVGPCPLQATLTITNNSGTDANNVTADPSGFPTFPTFSVNQTPSAGCTAPAHGTCTLTYCYITSVFIASGPYYVTVSGSNTNPVVVAFYFT